MSGTDGSIVKPVLEGLTLAERVAPLDNQLQVSTGVFYPRLNPSSLRGIDRIRIPVAE